MAQESFNFGQHIQLIDDTNYITDIKGELDEDSEQSTETKKVYKQYSATSFPITGGTFYLKCLVKPQSIDLTINIKLIDTNGQEKTLKDGVIIKPAINYLSILGVYEQDLTNLEAQISDAENTYNIAVEYYNECLEAKEDAQQAWENAGSKTEGQEYINYINASNNLIEAEDAMRWDREDLDSLRTEYNNTLLQYNSLLTTLVIPVEVSFTLSEVEYDHIQIEFLGESTFDIDFSVIFVKLKELLNNIIPQRVLKRIAIQGAADTKVFINGNQLTVGTTNILEISNPHFQISSLKILPSDFFIIDYEYLEGQQV